MFLNMQMVKIIFFVLYKHENNMQNNFSDVDIDHSEGTGTKLILQGKNTMGDLNIKHVKA